MNFKCCQITRNYGGRPFWRAFWTRHFSDHLEVLLGRHAQILHLGGKPFYRDGDQSLSITTCQSCVYIFQYPHVESHTFKFSTEVKALTLRRSLSMAEFSTPSQEKTTLSSVFMTPSSSCGRPVFHPAKSLLTPLQFSLPSTPLPSPARLAREEHKDILAGLFEAGLPLVAKRVLSLLDQGDLTK